MVHSFLSKYAVRSYKSFSPHLINICTLPCETYNAHRARATNNICNGVGNAGEITMGHYKLILWRWWRPL